MKKLAIIAALLLVTLTLGAGCAATRLAQPSPSSNPAQSPPFREAAPGESKATADTVLSGDSSSATTDRMVIYTANLSVQVENLAQSLDVIGRIARDAGGYLANVNREGRSSATATVTLRVPATTYEETLARLRHLAVKVLQENGATKDVGEEFADLTAQLRNMEAAEAQYRELLRRAQTIDEILKVQQRLEEIRGRIERTQGRMSYLERQAEMATITLAISEAPPPTPSWDIGQAAREAWETSLALWRTVASYGLYALVFGWWLPLPLVIAALVWRRRRRAPAPGLPGQA